MTKLRAAFRNTENALKNNETTSSMYVRIKLSVQAMKAYVRVEEQPHPFLTSANTLS
jgi:hypothetical protein